MDNACAEVVAQDKGPAAMWELSREAVRGVLSDPETQVTTQTATDRPVWEIWTIPYAKLPIIIFLKQILCPFFVRHCSAKKQISPSIQETLHLTVSLCLGKSNRFQNKLVSPARSDQFNTCYIRKFIALPCLKY